MVNRFFLIFLLIVCVRHNDTLALSDKARVSVLTYKPGNELYTIFGHTAIRITDSASHLDRIYNFGTFDFSSPFFYIRFIRGNLDYFLSAYDYPTFLNQSLIEKRKIYEQTLDINTSEANRLFSGLEQCYHSSERVYQYDFFYDNCATRVRDAVWNSFLIIPHYDTTDICCKSFRQLLRPYLKNNPWLNLGINLVLGRSVDDIASSSDFMFLPDYIFQILNLSGRVKGEKVLADFEMQDNHSLKNFLVRISPWLIILVLLGTGINKLTQKISFNLCMILTGSVGLLLLGLSIVSMNPAFASNWNVIWTLPAFLPILRRSEIFLWFYLILLICVFIFRSFLPQEIPLIMLPWILLLIFQLGLMLNRNKGLKNKAHQTLI